MRRMKLVFPESVGPSRMLSVPCAKVSETSSMWVSPWTLFVTCRSSSVMRRPLAGGGHGPARVPLNAELLAGSAAILAWNAGKEHTGSQVNNRASNHFNHQEF